jgi:hypothetical protein
MIFPKQTKWRKRILNTNVKLAPAARPILAKFPNVTRTINL